MKTKYVALKIKRKVIGSVTTANVVLADKLSRKFEVITVKDYTRAVA